jgi:hypothetical protein
MTWKNAIAASLSLLLLCATSLASACELSCSLSLTHPAVSSPVSARLADSMQRSSSATASEARTSAMTMSHSHCGHAGVRQPSSAATHHFEDASSCTSAPCTQAQVLSSPISGKNKAQIERSHLGMTVAIVSPVSIVRNSLDTIKLQHAPPELVLPDPLSVALRI